MTTAVGCGITRHEDSPHRKETDSAWGEGHVFTSVSMLCVTLQNCGRQQWCVNQTSYQEVRYSNNKTSHSSQHTTLAWPRRLESPPTCSKIPSQEGLEILEILLTLSTQNDTLLKNKTKQQKEIVLNQIWVIMVWESGFRLWMEFPEIQECMQTFTVKQLSKRTVTQLPPAASQSSALAK